MRWWSRVHVTPLVGHYRQIFWSGDYRSLNENGGVSTGQDRRSPGLEADGRNGALEDDPMARPP
jgi:hypothetical protein